MDIGLVVPVLNNFTGFAELMNSVDVAVKPIILDNWNGNRGVAASWNEGIRRAWDQEVVIIVNDDVVFYPGTITKLVESLREYELVSAVSTDTGQVGYLEDEKPDFACFAISPIYFTDTFGWFDENFKPGYFEDNDMHYRMQVKGACSALRLDGRVDHAGSMTQFKGSRDFNTNDRVVSHEQFRANRNYYAAKWGGEPGNEKYTQPFNMSHRSIKDWTKRD